MQKFLFLMFSMVCLSSESRANLHPLSDEFINAINQKQSSWKAGRNFGKDTPISFVKSLLGWIPSNDTSNLPTVRHQVDGVIIPEHFDWREKYPSCTTLSDIRDQGGCGSCWAFAAAAAISDRICISSEGKSIVYASDENILSCSKCGGCYGGRMECAYQYWKDHGIVSGGHYGSKQGCQPYEIPPCEHGVIGPRPSCSTEHHETPNCSTQCQNGYSVPYEKDLHFGAFVYKVESDVKQIQTEIMAHGPVTAGFVVYADFVSYKSGVYEHADGNELGRHGVKIIGWGVENEKPYWLIANSWNTDWGDKGYFKFVRGKNNCEMEGHIVAGMPV